mgnify:CR=1 FL=1
MIVACLDKEGVLVPEIWITFAERAGNPDFRRTTPMKYHKERGIHER